MAFEPSDWLTSSSSASFTQSGDGMGGNYFLKSDVYWNGLFEIKSHATSLKILAMLS